MRGAHRIAVTGLCGIVMALGLYVVIPVIGSL